MSSAPTSTESTGLTLESLSSTALSRRRLFALGGMAAAGAALAACGNNDEEPDVAATTAPPAEEASGGDVDLAAFAASLELLAVNTYKAGLDAATAGKLGAVPPAVAEYAKTAMAHHQEHFDAWDGIVTGADRESVTKPPAELEAAVNKKFGAVKDVVGLAKLALELEQIAADTYLDVLPKLESGDAKKLAGSIQAVDRQHQAILHFALGEYPVPIVFQTTKNSAVPK